MKNILGLAEKLPPNPTIPTKRCATAASWSGPSHLRATRVRNGALSLVCELAAQTQRNDRWTP